MKVMEAVFDLNHGSILDNQESHVLVSVEDDIHSGVP